MEEESTRSTTTSDDCEEKISVSGTNVVEGEEQSRLPELQEESSTSTTTTGATAAALLVNDDDEDTISSHNNLSTSPPAADAEIESNCSTKSEVESVEKNSTEGEGGGALSLRPSENLVSALKDKKINIRLNPVGDAPILKQKLWAVPADREVGQIIDFVKKYLKLEKHQSLFIFVNQAFAPSPDQQLKELYECFGSDGKITLHYSTTYAWG